MDPNMNMNFFNMQNSMPYMMANMNNMDVNGTKEEMVKHLKEQNKILKDLIEKNNTKIEQLMPNSYVKNVPTDLFQDYSGEKITISFTTNTGVKSFLIVPKNIKVSELLSAYMKSIKLNDILIDKSIIFLFNCSKLTNYNEKNISEVGLKNGSYITVVDQTEIIKAISAYI